MRNIALAVRVSKDIRYTLAIMLAQLLLFITAPCASIHAEPLKIGFIAPLTGTGSRMGESLREVLQMAHLKNITPVFQDDRCEAKAALSAYNQLRGQGIRVFYMACSGSILAVAPLAKRNGDLILTTYAGSARIRETGDEVIRFNPDALSVAEAVARLVSPELRPTTILYEEQDYAQSLTDRLYELLGSGIRERISYRPEAASFAAEILRLKQNRSKSVILIPVNESAADRIIRGMAEAKIAIPLIGEVNVCDYPYRPSDFGLHGTCVSARFDGAAFEGFTSEYKALFKHPPAYPFYVAIALDLLKQLDTLAATTLDPLALKNELLKGFSGSFARYALSSDGEVLQGEDYLRVERY